MELGVILPLGSSLFAGIGILICLALGLSNGNLSQPPWPYVSDTGASPPESCVFAMVLNWCAMFFMINGYVYYKYVVQHGHKSKLNSAALVVSIIGSAGFSLVGCFQYTQVFPVHAAGATAAFGGGNLYCWLIVILNIKYMKRDLAPQSVVAIRTILATLQSISLLIFFVIVCLDFDQINVDKDTLFTVMTSFEWAGTYLLLIYIGFFSYDFRQIRNFHLNIEALNLQSPNETMPLAYYNGGAIFDNTSNNNNGNQKGVIKTSL